MYKSSQNRAFLPIYPPTQKATGLPIDEYIKGNPFASEDVRPYLEKADRYSAKLPNENFGAKQNRLNGAKSLIVGLHRTICWVVLVAFSVTTITTTTPAHAQNPAIAGLPPIGTLLSPSASYTPAIMAGMSLHPKNPLAFDFIIDTGDDYLEGEKLREESQKLVSYFLASLTVPEDEMWVNLSPKEKDRIIADGLGQTPLGRDMLAQDYILKQLTASLMSPETESGAKLWEKLKEKGIDSNTLNKVWIVPDKASIYIKDNNVFIADSHLRVMLEEDYVVARDPGPVTRATAFGSRETSDESPLTTQIIKESILPEIEREVNEGKHFANLRQIYHALILATWYKENLKNSLLTQIYANQNKTEGITHNDPQIIQKLYNRYIESFKTGAYDYIKEEYNPKTQEVIPKKYFSGGFSAKELDQAMTTTGLEEGWLTERSVFPKVAVGVNAQIDSDAAMGADELKSTQPEDVRSLYYWASGSDVQTVVNVLNGLPNVDHVHLVDPGIDSTASFLEKLNPMFGKRSRTISAIKEMFSVTEENSDTFIAHRKDVPEQKIKITLDGSYVSEFTPKDSSFGQPVAYIIKLPDDLGFLSSLPQFYAKLIQDMNIGDLVFISDAWVLDEVLNDTRSGLQIRPSEGFHLSNPVIKEIEMHYHAGQWVERGGWLVYEKTGESDEEFIKSLRQLGPIDHPAKIRILGSASLPTSDAAMAGENSNEAIAELAPQVYRHIKHASDATDEDLERIKIIAGHIRSFVTHLERLNGETKLSDVMNSLYGLKRNLQLLSPPINGMKLDPIVKFVLGEIKIERYGHIGSVQDIKSYFLYYLIRGVHTFKQIRELTRKTVNTHRESDSFNLFTQAFNIYQEHHLTNSAVAAYFQQNEIFSLFTETDPEKIVKKITAIKTLLFIGPDHIHEQINGFDQKEGQIVLTARDWIRGDIIRDTRDGSEAQIIKRPAKNNSPDVNEKEATITIRFLEDPFEFTITLAEANQYFKLIKRKISTEQEIKEVYSNPHLHGIAHDITRFMTKASLASGIFRKSFPLPDGTIVGKTLGLRLANNLAHVEMTVYSDSNNAITHMVFTGYKAGTDGKKDEKKSKWAWSNGELVYVESAQERRRSELDKEIAELYGNPSLNNVALDITDYFTESYLRSGSIPHTFPLPDQNAWGEKNRKIHLGSNLFRVELIPHFENETLVSITFRGYKIMADGEEIRESDWAWQEEAFSFIDPLSDLKQKIMQHYEDESFDGKALDVTEYFGEYQLARGRISESFPRPDGLTWDKVDGTGFNFGVNPVSRVEMVPHFENGKLQSITFIGYQKSGKKETRIDKESHWIWRGENFEYQDPSNLLRDIYTGKKEHGQLHDITSILTDFNLERGLIGFSFILPNDEMLGKTLRLRIGKNLKAVKMKTHSQKGELTHLLFTGYKVVNGRFVKTKTSKWKWTGSKLVYINPLSSLKQAIARHYTNPDLDGQSLDVTDYFSESHLRYGTIRETFPLPGKAQWGPEQKNIRLGGKKFSRIELTPHFKDKKLQSITFTGFRETKKGEVEAGKSEWRWNGKHFDYQDPLETIAELIQNPIEQKTVVIDISDYLGPGGFKTGLIGTTFPLPDGTTIGKQTFMRVGKELSKVLLAIHYKDGAVEGITFAGFKLDAKMEVATSQSYWKWDGKSFVFQYKPKKDDDKFITADSAILGDLQKIKILLRRLRTILRVSFLTPLVYFPAALFMYIYADANNVPFLDNFRFPVDEWLDEPTYNPRIDFQVYGDEVFRERVYSALHFVEQRSHVAYRKILVNRIITDRGWLSPVGIRAHAHSGVIRGVTFLNKDDAQRPVEEVIYLLAHEAGHTRNFWNIRLFAYRGQGREQREEEAVAYAGRAFQDLDLLKEIEASIAAQSVGDQAMVREASDAAMTEEDGWETRAIKITIFKGLHSRPSVELIRLARDNPDHKFSMVYQGKNITQGLKNLSYLFRFAIKRGSTITFGIKGPNQKTLMNLVERVFTEEEYRYHSAHKSHDAAMATSASNLSMTDQLTTLTGHLPLLNTFVKIIESLGSVDFDETISYKPATTSPQIKFGQLPMELSKAGQEFFSALFNYRQISPQAHLVFLKREKSTSEDEMDGVENLPVGISLYDTTQDQNIFFSLLVISPLMSSQDWILNQVQRLPTGAPASNNPWASANLVLEKSPIIGDIREGFESLMGDFHMLTIKQTPRPFVSEIFPPNHASSHDYQIALINRRNIFPGKKVHVIGPGSGIDAAYALKFGAKSVTFYDTNQTHNLLTAWNIQFLQDLGFIPKNKKAQLVDGVVDADVYLFNTPAIDSQEGIQIAADKIIQDAESVKSGVVTVSLDDMSGLGEALREASTLFNRSDRNFIVNGNSRAIHSSFITINQFMELMETLKQKLQNNADAVALLRLKSSDRSGLLPDAPDNYEDRVLSYLASLGLQGEHVEEASGHMFLVNKTDASLNNTPEPPQPAHTGKFVELQPGKRLFIKLQEIDSQFVLFLNPDGRDSLVEFSKGFGGLSAKPIDLFLNAGETSEVIEVGSRKYRIKNTDSGFSIINETDGTLSFIINLSAKMQKPGFQKLFTSDKAIGADESAPGGIDFNANRLKLNTEGDIFKFDIPENLQHITPQQIKGITPVIIHITPITNFPLMLGLDTKNKSPVVTRSQGHMSQAGELKNLPLPVTL